MESVRGPECLERVKKLRDFAFVHFTDRESAKAAMEHWNKKELDGSVVEVTWAKPNHKGTKHLKRGGYPVMQYVLPPGMGSAAGHHPGVLNVYSGRGTYGSSHVESSSSWRGGRTFIMLPPPIIGPRAPEVLSEYCHKNNWGEPYFSIMPVNSLQEEKVYMCRVMIPQYPGDQSQFQTPKISLSTEQAKILAAEITLFHLSSAGHTSALTEGYNHTSVVPAGHVMPQPSAASFSAGNGLQTRPELSIAYALPPNQAPGYLVHGEVGGYNTQFYDSQYQVQM